MIETTTRLAFSLFENPGVYALLLGSGLSRAAQIPTGWEIVLDLTQRVAALEGVSDQPDWAAWYRKRFGKEPNYSDLLNIVAQSPDERRSILHRYIEPTKNDSELGRKAPTKAHRAIARLVRDGFIKVIVTTNFDRLLESALRGEGVEPTVIKSDDDISGAVPLLHSKCYVVKVHGDYLDTRIRNTEAELEGYSTGLNTLLDRIFDEHGLLVCGWSAEWDHALRAAIARAPSRRYPTYWAARGQPSTVAADLVRHRGGEVIKISDADSFFEELQRKVQIQAELNRPDPRSIDLLVGSAKKFVSSPDYRIQLHDLIFGEVRRLREFLENDEFSVQSQWSPEEFRRRVGRYEASCEPLLHLFAVLGRWGAERELDLVKEVLQELGAKRSEGGSLPWIALRTYPAVLLLYAFGISALKARHLGVVYDWLMVPIPKEQRNERVPAAQQLLLWAWEGGSNDYWRNMTGFEQRKTPLSDHLHGFFLSLLHDEFLSEEDFTAHIAKFELLGSVAYLSTATKDELSGALGASSGGRGYVWAPLGRVAWLSRVRDAIMSDLAMPSARRGLAKAGFGQGDESILDLTFKNLAVGMSQISWR
jgi:hypothetical protein